MKLVQLNYLVALEQYGSISAAAEKLYVSQPAVSVAIKELEHELGQPLIIRSNQGIVFTEYGTQIALKAKEILALSDQILHYAKYSGGQLTGSVRLLCTPPYCKILGVTAMKAVQKYYPGIRLQVIAMDSDDTVLQVSRSTDAIGVIHTRDVYQLTLQEMIGREQLRYGSLFQDRLQISVRPGHPLTDNPHILLSDLTNYPLVTPSPNINPDITELYYRARAAHSILQISDACTLREYIQQTDALALIPRVALDEGNRQFSAPLVGLDVDGLTQTCTIGWITQHQVKPEVQAVLELLMTHARQIPGIIQASE